MKRHILVLLASLFFFSGVSPTLAGEGDWTLALKGGPGFMLKSKSTSIPHLFKPIARLEGSRGLTDHTSVGLELASIASSNHNYRMIKLSALIRGDLYRGSLYALWVRGGFGVGNSPAILSQNLDNSSDLSGHVDLGIGMSWQLPFADSALGLEIISDNLSVVSLLSSLSFQL